MAAKKAAKRAGTGNAGARKIRLKKKSKQHFNVPNSEGRRRMKSVKPRWRKPRGVDNKKKKRCAFMGKCPRVGNKNSADCRGLHPLGLPELMVHNANDLAGAESVLVRIAGGVGKRKRAEIVAKANEMNLRVLNANAKVVG